MSSGRNRIAAIPVRGSTQGGLSTVTIKWSAPGLVSVQIRVSDNGSTEKLFAAGGQAGTARASFVTPGHVYVFALYGPSDRTLATTVVKGAAR
jgi:hypothetical protein